MECDGLGHRNLSKICSRITGLKMKDHDLVEELNKIAAITLLISSVVFIFVIVIWILCISPHNWRLLNLLFIFGGSFALGCIPGWILGPAPDESASLKTALQTINGIIGGLAVADISKSDSLIIKGLRSLSFASGLERIGTVAPAVCFYFSIGFIFMYANKYRWIHGRGGRNGHRAYSIRDNNRKASNTRK